MSQQDRLPLQPSPDSTFYPKLRKFYAVRFLEANRGCQVIQVPYSNWLILWASIAHVFRSYLHVCDGMALVSSNRRHRLVHRSYIDHMQVSLLSRIANLSWLVDIPARTFNWGLLRWQIVEQPIIRVSGVQNCNSLVLSTSKDHSSIDWTPFYLINSRLMMRWWVDIFTLAQIPNLHCPIRRSWRQNVLVRMV